MCWSVYINTPLKQHPRIESDIGFELQTPTDANINSPSVEKLPLIWQCKILLPWPTLLCFKTNVFNRVCGLPFSYYIQTHVTYNHTLCLFVCTMTMFEMVYPLLFLKTSLIAQESIQVSYFLVIWQFGLKCRTLQVLQENGLIFQCKMSRFCTHNETYIKMSEEHDFRRRNICSQQSPWLLKVSKYSQRSQSVVLHVPKH